MTTPEQAREIADSLERYDAPNIRRAITALRELAYMRESAEGALSACQGRCRELRAALEAKER